MVLLLMLQSSKSRILRESYMTSIESLEQRVAALERSFAQWLHPQQQSSPWKDWRQAVGKYVPNEITAEIDAAGREIREADRKLGAS